MATTFRLIAQLDIRSERLVKTIRREGVRPVGDPAEYVRMYDAEGIDEILYLDIVASLYGRNGLHQLVQSATHDAFVPVTAGGGIRSIEDAKSLFDSGADKIALNTAAIKRPELIGEIATKYGSQAVVLQLDAKRQGDGWEAYCDGGRQPTGRSAASWAAEAVERGAGEILATSIDREGTRAGFDLALTEAVSSLPVPVIAAGGFGAVSHAVEAYRAGASGIALAGDLHYRRTSLEQIRVALDQAGIAVRRMAS